MQSKANGIYWFDFGDGIRAPSGAFAMSNGCGIVSGTSQQLRYRLIDVQFIRSAGASLSAPLADALDISLAAYWADRCALRPAADPLNHNRRMHIRIPVRRPAQLSRSHVRNAIQDFLALLTGDEWLLEFVERVDPPRGAEQQQVAAFMRGRSDQIVILNSGGLDSCLGLIRVAEQARAVLAVSVSSHPRVTKVQRQVVGEVRYATDADIYVSQLRLNLAGVARRDQESSQRARSIVHLAVGSIASALSGNNTLHLCENGIGAINLPYILSQVGAHSSRAVHPSTLVQFRRMFELVTDHPLEVVNLGLWKTKTELCNELLTDNRFVRAASETVSCDRFPRAVSNRPCGSCTSCLLRAVSLQAAGLDIVDNADIRPFGFDPRSHEASWNQRNAGPFRAMQMQVARLEAALAVPNPFLGLLDEFPEVGYVFDYRGALGMTREGIEGALTRLFAAYVDEWHEYEQTVVWPEERTVPVVSVFGSAGKQRLAG